MKAPHRGKRSSVAQEKMDTGAQIEALNQALRLQLRSAI